jgi:hypothetical protein
MPSTYTTNLGIEKIATGEQSGTWGNTTNINLDLIDGAIDGVISINVSSAGSSGSPNSLPITDGAVSNGRNKFIEFTDGGDLGANAFFQLTPNNAEKIVHVRNSLSGSRSLILFQGTYNASNDFEVPAGKDVVLKFDGGGTSATVTQVFANLLATAFTGPLTGNVTGNVTGNLTGNVTGDLTGNVTGDLTGNVTGNVTGNISSTGPSSFSSIDVNGGAIDGTPIGANSPATGAFTSLSTTGTAAIATADINAGEIDGTNIGANTPATGAFTTLNATGTATLATVDINAGAIDGTNIGASTPGTGVFSALTTSGDSVTIQTTQTPASASATGTTGEIAWDSNYLYVCVASNTWKRVAIDTWS